MLKKLLCAAILLALVLSLCAPVAATAVADGYSDAIAPDTALLKLKSGIYGITAAKRNGSALSDDEAIATGDILTVNGSNRTAVVAGDVNGDGKVNALDYLKLKRHILKVTLLSGEFLLACDVDGDGTPTALDYLRIKRHFIGTFDIASTIYASDVAVLLYHHIVPDAVKKNDPTWKDNSVTSSISQLREHMTALRDDGCTVVTIDDVVNFVKGKRVLPKKSVALCFDDGYRSNTEYAAPVLREFGFKATVFTAIGQIQTSYEPYNDAKLQHFSWDEMDATSDVFTFYSHTYRNHNYLTQQTPTEVLTDLNKGQADLPCEYFAYPYGAYNASVIATVKQAGFTAAFTTVTRRATTTDNAFEIPRYSVTPSTTVAMLLGYVG